jgi:hypothetical protein
MQPILSKIIENNTGVQMKLDVRKDANHLFEMIFTGRQAANRAISETEKVRSIRPSSTAHQSIPIYNFDRVQQYHRVRMDNCPIRDDNLRQRHSNFVFGFQRTVQCPFQILLCGFKPGFCSSKVIATYCIAKIALWWSYVFEVFILRFKL